MRENGGCSRFSHCTAPGSGISLDSLFENVNLIYKKWIDTAPHKDLSVHCCTDIDVSDGGLLCVAA